MKSITISIPDDRSQELQQAAAKLGITPEDLVRVSLEQVLDRPEEAFDNALKYVYEKNEPFYRRLV